MNVRIIAALIGALIYATIFCQDLPQSDQYESYQTDLLDDEDIASSSEDAQIVYERWADATDDYSWALEIKNDSKYPYILTGLTDGSRHPTFLGKTMVGPQGISIGRAKGADQKDKGYLRIAGSTRQDTPRATVWPIDPAREIRMLFTFRFLGRPESVFEVTIKKNPKRTKIFLTIDESSEFDRFSIRPQKGTGIFSPVSQSGVSLKGNVSSSEIRVRQIQ